MFVFFGGRCLFGGIFSPALFIGVMTGAIFSIITSYFFPEINYSLLAVAGIPPLIGFFSKFLVLLQLVGQSYIISAVVIVISITIIIKTLLIMT